MFWIIPKIHRTVTLLQKYVSRNTSEMIKTSSDFNNIQETLKQIMQSNIAQYSTKWPSDNISMTMKHSEYSCNIVEIPCAMWEV